MEQVLTRMPQRLKELLKAEADRKGISLNAQVLSILWHWAESNED